MKRARKPALRRTLVLTQGYVPHKVVTWQTALTNYYKGSVEIVASYDENICSPSTTIAMPAVVRLLKAIPNKKKAIKFSRVNLYTRDNYTCQYCGVKKGPSGLNYDHVVPRCKGGKSIWTNLTCSCIPCNTKKGSRTPAEAGMTLRSIPFIPKSLPMQPQYFEVRSLPAEWKPYVPEGVANEVA